MMQLIPSIDLLKGEVVRLRHGAFNEVTTYPLSAAALAQRYAAEGAEWLHMVDLAASRDGPAADASPLFKLLSQCPQRVQPGGGVRQADDITQRLQHGADRVVVGTLCVTDTARFIGWLDRFGADRLVSALDVALADDGIPWPRTHGWTEGGARNLWDLLDELAGAGLRHLLCTDIGKDGALRGPNVVLYQQMVERYPGLQIQASGGVSGLNDLRELAATGVASAISGKALLEECFSVEDAIQALRRNGAA